MPGQSKYRRSFVNARDRNWWLPVAILLSLPHCFQNWPSAKNQKHEVVKHAILIQ